MRMISKQGLLDKIGTLEVKIEGQARSLAAIEKWMRETLEAFWVEPNTYFLNYGFGYGEPSNPKFPHALAKREDLQAVLDHLKMKVCDVSPVPGKRVLKKTCEKK